MDKKFNIDGLEISPIEDSSKNDLDSHESSKDSIKNN